MIPLVTVCQLFQVYNSSSCRLNIIPIISRFNLVEEILNFARCIGTSERLVSMMLWLVERNMSMFPWKKINLSAVHSINSGTFKALFPGLLQQNQMIYIYSQKLTLQHKVSLSSLTQHAQNVLQILCSLHRNKCGQN